MFESKRSNKDNLRLFKQTVTAFVTAIEEKDRFHHGHSLRVAELSRQIAQRAGKKAGECENVYYAALLHDVGMIAIPDGILKKPESDLEGEELETLKRKPLISSRILSQITEFPFLSAAARSCCERWDGRGYPDGIKGEEIPDISRIIALADAYDHMTSAKIGFDPLPLPMVREEIMKGAGTAFDPDYTKVMLSLIDEEDAHQEDGELEDEILCGAYREKVTMGISVTEDFKILSFDCEEINSGEGGFAAPSVIVFDSFDRRVHREASAIKSYRYYEYGEIWFDGHSITTGARNLEVKSAKTVKAAGGKKNGSEKRGGRYEVRAARHGDHLKLILTGPGNTSEALIALPDISKPAFVALTGENCRLSAIRVEGVDKRLNKEDYDRIAEEIDYIDRMQSDLPNIQIDKERSASTEGVPIKDGRDIIFHAMSLPSASLVWHCPYIVIFHSDDRKVGGKNYREDALIKLNGEVEAGEGAQTGFSMKKSPAFQGWDRWKQEFLKGLECEVIFQKTGNRVTLRTQNLGIEIESVTTVDENAKIYAAVTGDRVAVTDIRVL